MKSLLLGLVWCHGVAGPCRARRVPAHGLGQAGFLRSLRCRDANPVYPSWRSGSSATYIDAEAAAQWEDGAVRRYENSMRDRDPNRGPPPKGANVDARSYDPVWFDQGLKMFKIGGRIPTSIIVDPPNGQIPPGVRGGDCAVAGVGKRAGTKTAGGTTTPKNLSLAGSLPVSRARLGSQRRRWSTTTSRPSCRPRIM